MHGGEQESGFRAGTLAVHNIVGFGKAAEIAVRESEKDRIYLKHIDERLVKGLQSVPGIVLTNPTETRLPGIISVLVELKDFNNERFVKEISDILAISTGSACSAGEPSYVIKALGLEEKVSKVLRISLNKYTSEKDIDELLYILKQKLS